MEGRKKRVDFGKGVSSGVTAEGKDQVEGNFNAPKQGWFSEIPELGGKKSDMRT